MTIMSMTLRSSFQGPHLLQAMASPKFSKRKCDYGFDLIGSQPFFDISKRGPSGAVRFDRDAESSDGYGRRFRTRRTVVIETMPSGQVQVRTVPLSRHRHLTFNPYGGYQMGDYSDLSRTRRTLLTLDASSGSGNLERVLESGKIEEVVGVGHAATSEPSLRAMMTSLLLCGLERHDELRAKASRLSGRVERRPLV